MGGSHRGPSALCIECGSEDLWQKAMKQLNASVQGDLHADQTVDAIDRLLYKTQDKEHLKKADELKSQKGLKEKMDMCGNTQAARDRAQDAEDNSIQSNITAAMATWRASTIRETVPSSRFLGLGDCLPLIDHAREPNDDAFLDDTFQYIPKDADIFAIRTFLEDTSKLNSKSPNADIQRCCDMILSSSASAVTNRDFYDIRDMRGFLQHHLSVAEPAIEEAKAQAKKRKAADGTSGDKKKGRGDRR